MNLPFFCTVRNLGPTGAVLQNNWRNLLLVVKQTTQQKEYFVVQFVTVSPFSSRAVPPPQPPVDPLHSREMQLRVQGIPCMCIMRQEFSVVSSWSEETVVGIDTIRKNLLSRKNVVAQASPSEGQIGYRRRNTR